MIKKNNNLTLKDNFRFVFDLIKEYKIKTIILSAFILIAFLTGLIVAFKTKTNYDTLNSLGVVCFTKNGGINASFFTRLLSMLFIALICFGCSFNKFLFPIAILFLSYRGYLLGINICLIIVANGIGGVITALLIALPCQLIALAILALFYLVLAKSHADFCSFGGSRVKNQKVRILLLGFIVLVLVCVLESILLAIFSPKVILVI